MLLAWIQRGKTVDNMTLNWMSPQRLLQTQATSFSESERLQIADLYANVSQSLELQILHLYVDTAGLRADICLQIRPPSLTRLSITKLRIVTSLVLRLTRAPNFWNQCWTCKSRCLDSRDLVVNCGRLWKRRGLQYGTRPKKTRTVWMWRRQHRGRDTVKDLTKVCVLVVWQFWIVTTY